MPFGRLAARAAALTAVAACAAACFSGPSPSGPADGAAASPGTARIRLALPFTPVAGLSPTSGNDAVLATRMGVTETLVDLDPTGRPQPALATSWANPDPLTWTFTLAPGVAFHDGTPLTAAAVADALTRATRATPLPRSLAGTALTVTAEGTDTVRVSTDQPDPVLPQRLSSPELVILAPSGYAGATPSPVRAGTGPFVLEELQGTAGARLERFDRYRGGAVAAPGVDVRFLPDGAARTNGLRAGELDVVQAVPISGVASLGDRTVLSVPLPRSVTAYLNQGSAVLADPGLRAAVRDAVGTVDAAATIYEGQADRAVGLFGPASPWTTDRPARTFTPATAPTGQSLRIGTYTDRPELPELASAVADALRRAGFTPEVTAQEYSTIEPQLLGGSFDVVIGARSYLLDTGDPIGYLASDFGCAGSYNLARLCDPALDATIAAAAPVVDVRARQQAALQVEAQLLDRDVVVPLITERARIGLAPGVKGVPSDPFERALVTAATTAG